MKNPFFLLAIPLIVSCAKEQQDHHKSAAVNSVASKVKSHSLALKNDLNTVSGIKQEYALVNAKLLDKKLDSVAFSYECDELSGNVVYYSEKGSLKAIKHFRADSHFSSTENYFVDSGKPYFIFTDEKLWSFDGGTPEKPETKDDVTEHRFYIVKDEAIQCLEKKYTLKSGSPNNPKSETLPNKEMKNCSLSELKKTYDLLIKHQGNHQKVKCL